MLEERNEEKTEIKTYVIGYRTLIGWEFHGFNGFGRYKDATHYENRDEAISKAAELDSYVESLIKAKANVKVYCIRSLIKNDH